MEFEKIKQQIHDVFTETGVSGKKPGAIARIMDIITAAATAPKGMVRVDPKPVAWIVFCPPGHEYDSLLFPDKDEADEQATLFNDDYPEGENPHEAVPLYPATVPAKESRIVEATGESIDILTCTNGVFAQSLVNARVCVTDNTGTVRAWIEDSGDAEGDWEIAEAVKARLVAAAQAARERGGEE